MDRVQHVLELRLGYRVTIRVSDPRVPGCEDEPDLPGCQVVVLSIGRGIAVRQVQTAGTTQGLTTAGAAVRRHARAACRFQPHGAHRPQRDSVLPLVVPATDGA